MCLRWRVGSKPIKCLQSSEQINAWYEFILRFTYSDTSYVILHKCCNTKLIWQNYNKKLLISFKIKKLDLGKKVFSVYKIGETVEDLQRKAYFCSGVQPARCCKTQQVYLGNNKQRACRTVVPSQLFSR